MAIAASFFEEVTHREDRAAEVGQHDDPLAAVRFCDRYADRIASRTQRSVRSTASRLDADIISGHLGRERGKTAGELKTVGDQYNPDQPIHTPIKFRTTVVSLHYRQQFSNAE